MSFADGWYSGAIRRDAHPQRIGGGIQPWAIVVHTTDMAPETWTALLESWSSKPGAGDCAHFVIGREPADGIVQFVPITRNANHAGGPHHGVFVDTKGNQFHPNLVAVGIELHCAGGVQLISGQWRLIEDGHPTGVPIADFDVIPDPLRKGRGWHQVTDYQYGALDALLDELERVLPADPAGAVARSPYQTPASWAVGNGRLVGHCSLDFLDRSDPWPPTMEWLRARVTAA